MRECEEQTNGDAIMNRRDFFLTGAATGLVIGGGAGYLLKSGQKGGPAKVAAGGTKLNWTMVTTWPEKFPGLGRGGIC